MFAIKKKKEIFNTNANNNNYTNIPNTTTNEEFIRSPEKEIKLELFENESQDINTYEDVLDITDEINGK
jgi:hypothetical protein